MIALPPQVRVFLYRLPTDMRKSFHGLVALVESAVKQDPLSGSLFVFLNRQRDRIKILYWGQTGFCIWYQQLQKGTYQLPDEKSLEEQQTIEVTRSQLSLILDGIDLSSARQRMRYRLPRERLEHEELFWFSGKCAIGCCV
jgi:transposase